MDEIFDALREEIKAEVPELETEFVPARPGPDQRPRGRRTADRSQGLRPRRRRSSASWPRRSARSSKKVEGVVDVNTHVLLGNPDIVVRPDSVQTARVGLTELDIESQLNAALYGQVASTVPEQDRMTKIRVRYPDRVRYDREHLGPTADQPGDGHARSTRQATGRGSASSRSVNSRRSESSAARMSSGGRISSPSSR